MLDDPRRAIMDFAVQVSGGRTLQVRDSGDPAGTPVLVQSGTPGSRYLYGPNVEDARLRGVRLISYDRPGYGGSAPQPGRSVADCAADVRAICAALGIRRLGIWGPSGGGPHVLACAALLPDLVGAAATLASNAPWDAEGLDYLAGSDEAFIADIRLLMADKEAARARWDEESEKVMAASVDEAARARTSQPPPAGAAAISGGLARYLALTHREGVSPGSEGWWEDSCAFYRQPWGFDLADISVPVLVLHGRQDTSVPVAHGEWLAAHIPGAEARFFDNEGHTTLRERIPEVHAWLLDHLRAD
jgi:pimeloyl-ACP methyl ester carboxylesterase